MKKFLIVILAIFLANLGCKKIDDGNRLCACSPVEEPALVLVIKNSEGVDLLNPINSGYFSNNQVQLYQRNENGSLKQITFYIRPPFSYGNEKFNYYSLGSSEIIRLTNSINQDSYLKLGNNKPIKINIERAENSFSLGKLLINGVEKGAETSAVSNYVRNIYYIELPHVY